MNNDPGEELPIQSGDDQAISDGENIVYTVNNRPPFEHPASNDVASMTEADRALISRYRFYNRLDPRSESSLIMPRHVIPASFFSIVTLGVVGKQGSLVTIFSIWNTMMGTALLAMPWAFNQAGFILGISCIISMGLLAYYTAFRVIDNTEKVAQTALDKNIEFVDVCRYYFGAWGDATALMFSLVSLLGATIVYWVLMSNFLYYTGTCIYEAIYVSDSPMSIISMNTSMACDVVCGSHPNISESTLIDPSSPFSYWWQLKKTVPFYLFLLIFPFLNFESPTFFTAFNGLGTVSVFYLLIFVSTKLYKCGVHFSLTGLSELGDTGSGIHLFKSSFPSLTGTLALSYFLHNCVVTIMKNQRTPKHNVRDLGIAYFLVMITYLLVAILFFVGFPLRKDCIADNFLNNFGVGDLLSAVARIFLLFQMLTVYPLLAYLIRIQIFYRIYKDVYPSAWHVIGLNLLVNTCGILFALFYPSVGSILRYVGSISGLVYVFALPCLVHMKRLEAEGQLTRSTKVIHYSIVFAGIANLIAQFI